MENKNKKTNVIIDNYLKENPMPEIKIEDLDEMEYPSAKKLGDAVADFYKNKYYTPELEEFCVGFEYEKKEDKIAMYYPEGETYWHRCIYDLKSIRISQLPTHLYKKNIRVKHLDREDIESLGFIPVIPSNVEDKKNYNVSCWVSNQYRASWQILDCGNSRYLITFGQHEFTNKSKDYFQGTIKNKTELRKLMKQLNIESDN